MMTLEQAAKQAGGGNRIRFSEWPAGIYWIVPTNDLMTFETEFPNDSCTDKAVLTGRLLVEPKWEVVAPEIRAGDRVETRSGYKGTLLAIAKQDNGVNSIKQWVLLDSGVVAICDNTCCTLIEHTEVPDES